MRKIRVLTILISVIMLLSILPVIPASAEGTSFTTSNPGVAIAAVMNEMNGNHNFKSAYPTEDNVYWSTLDLDFTKISDVGDVDGLSVLSGDISFSEVDGAVFSETKSGFKFYREVNASVPTWGPMALTKYFGFGFKLNSNGSLTFKGGDAWSGSQALLEFTPDTVSVYGSETENDGTKVLQTNLADYSPGTEWNDVLLYKTHNDGNKGGYLVYIKKVTDTTFTKLAEVEFFAGGGSLKRGVEFEGANVSVGYAACYQGSSVLLDQTTDEILESPKGSTYGFDFDENTNFANTSGREGFTAEGYKSEADGLTLLNPADTESVFTFAPFGQYSPLNGLTNWTADTYEPQALYVKAKGNFKLLIPAPKIYGRIDMDVQVGKEIAIKNSWNRFDNPVVIQNEWTEYLIIPNELDNNDSWIMNGGYTLYVKADAATNGKWCKVKEYGYENPSTAYSSYGISFYGVTGHIKSIRTLAISKSISEQEAVPGKTSLYFNEDFNTVPSYTNTSIGNAVCQNGYLKFPTTTGSMDYKVTDAEIPVGGYAEFRVQYDGVAHYRVSDGSTGVSISQQSDYSSITGGVGYVGNNNTTWRTWRVVRTESGYHIYSQSEGDTGWVVHATDASSSTTQEAGIYFNFGTRNGGGTGDSKLDYLRIYGPSLGEMVLTDRNTTRVISANENPPYPKEVYAKVAANPQRPRKLILAKYDSRGILFAAEQLDIPAGEFAQKILDLSDPEGQVANYKIYLWDGINGVTPYAMSKVVKGNYKKWTEDWTVTGNARIENDLILVSAQNEIVSTAEMTESIGDRFDLSWKMSIDSFDGEKSVRITTGSRLIELCLTEESISYQTKNGEKSVPWTLDSKEHTYRVVGNGRNATLLIDGYYVIKLESLPDSAEESKIKFINCGGSAQEGTISVYQYKKSEYSSSNLPTEGFFDDFTTQNSWYLHNSDGSSFELKDGMLQVEDYALLTSRNVHISKNIPVADDYIFSTRIKIESFGDTGWFVAYMPTHALVMELKQMFMAVSTPNGQGAYTGYSDGMVWDTTKWYDLRIETYNKCDSVRVYLDGIKVYEDKLSPLRSSSSKVVQFLANGGLIDPYTMKLDWFHCAPKKYDLNVTGVTDGAVFRQGEDIVVGASSTKSLSRNVNYIINGNVVATGKGDDNQAVISGLKEGFYELTPVSELLSGCSVRFEVKKEREADLNVAVTGGNVSASLMNRSGFEDVASVSYLLDGVEVAVATSGNYAVSISNVASGNHTLEAVCYNGGGVVVKGISRGISVEETISTNYANEVSYLANGDGMIQFANGNHLFRMNHSGGKVTYLTDSGEETYDYGTGEFYAVTEGPVADVYRNGQFVFSFFMPMKRESCWECTGDLANAVVKATPERKTYFKAENITDCQEVYRLADLPSRYVLDFVVKSGTQLHLAINDGYYRNDVSIESGSINVWNGQRNNSFATKTRVGAVASVDTYYRLETFDGLSRLYANGRFVAAFRGGITVGDSTLSVQVKSGILKYLAVCDYVDLYLHSDNFSGNYEPDLQSLGYWTPQNINLSVDDVNQVLVLEASEQGYTTLSADCGNVEFSADVTVESGNGFWIVNNLGYDTTYNKAGYNFQTGEFEIADVVNGEVKNKVTKVGILPRGEKVSLKVSVRESVEGETVTLYVNGEEMLSQNTEFVCRGQVGFMIDSGKASVDDVAFRGDSKLIYGENNTFGLSGITVDALEDYETGKIYMVNMSGGSVTTDGGKTWEKFTLASGAGYAIEGWGGMSQHMVQLKSGSVLSACLQPTGQDEHGQSLVGYRIYKSLDYGMNWVRTSSGGPTAAGIEQAGVAISNTVNCLKQGYSGRVYFTKQAGSSEDDGGLEVWYSDDEGKRWTKSKTEILSKNLGFVISEGFVVETSKHTRLYFRTDMGTLAYFVSYNRGVTWDLAPKLTPFASGACCFSIDADPNDPDCLYAGWSYDNVNYFARHQFPRTRWSVAKSTDGGDTWEMVGTVNEDNSYYHENTNLSLSVTSEYVFMNAYSQQGYMNGGTSKGRTISFPRASQRTSKRFEQLHSQYPDQVENTRVMRENLMDRTMVVHPSNGYLWVRGELYQDGASGELIDLHCGAALVGATVKANAGGGYLLEYSDRRHHIGYTDVTMIGNKPYVEVEFFANRFGLSIVQEGDVLIVSENDDWSQRQKKALRYVVDLFNSEP